MDCNSGGFNFCSITMVADNFSLFAPVPDNSSVCWVQKDKTLIAAFWSSPILVEAVYNIKISRDNLILKLQPRTAKMSFQPKKFLQKYQFSQNFATEKSTWNQPPWFERTHQFPVQIFYHSYAFQLQAPNFWNTIFCPANALSETQAKLCKVISWKKKKVELNKFKALLKD